MSDYCVECPNCGDWRDPEFDYVPEDSTYQSVFKCPRCEHLFTEDECQWMKKPPHPIEPERAKKYGVGIDDGKGGYGMTDGMFNTIAEALTCHGEQGSRLIRFNVDGTNTIMFRWRKDQWHRTGQ